MPGHPLAAPRAARHLTPLDRPPREPVQLAVAGAAHLDDLPVVVPASERDLPDDPVQQQGRVLDLILPLRVPPPDLSEGRTVVMVNSDEEALRIKAVNLDEAVVVRSGTADDQEDEIVVVVELRPLPELLRILDRQRVESEHLPENVEVIMVGLVEVEPEELIPSKQLLDRLPAELHLPAAVVAKDMANRRPRPIRLHAPTIWSLDFELPVHITREDHHDAIVLATRQLTPLASTGGSPSARPE
jgi:hypothetical protein